MQYCCPSAGLSVEPAFQLLTPLTTLLTLPAFLFPSLLSLSLSHTLFVCSAVGSAATVSVPPEVEVSFCPLPFFSLLLLLLLPLLALLLRRRSWVAQRQQSSFVVWLERFCASVCVVWRRRGFYSLSPFLPPPCLSLNESWLTLECFVRVRIVHWVINNC